MQSFLPPEELRQDFTRRRTRQWLLVIPGILGVIILRTLPKSGDTGILGINTTVLLIAGIAIILGVIALTVINWRCPSCSKYLGRSINPKFCGGCGFQLR